MASTEDRTAIVARQHNPRLDFTFQSDRVNYQRLVLFVAFMRMMAVQQAILALIAKKLDLKVDVDDDDNEATQLWTRLVADAVEFDLELDHAAGPMDATTYDLRKLAKRVESLGELMSYVRQLPGNIFPREFWPTAEFVVRCQNVAQGQATPEPAKS